MEERIELTKLERLALESKDRRLYFEAKRVEDIRAELLAALKEIAEWEDLPFGEPNYPALSLAKTARAAIARARQ